MHETIHTALKKALPPGTQWSVDRGQPGVWHFIDLTYRDRAALLQYTDSGRLGLSAPGAPCFEVVPDRCYESVDDLVAATLAMLVTRKEPG